MNHIMQRDNLINKVNLLSESIGERWESLTTRQVKELEEAIEKSWGIIDRRKQRVSHE